MSTPQNSLELVDRYLQAVRFWLPKTSRQQDLVAELGEDLRSQIEETEMEIGRPLDKKEIADTLAAVGIEQSTKRKCEGCGAGIARWRKGRAVPKNTRFCSDRCSQKARRLSGASTPVLKPDSAQKAA